jgi:hypothetical protein
MRSLRGDVALHGRRSTTDQGPTPRGAESEDCQPVSFCDSSFACVQPSLAIAVLVSGVVAKSYAEPEAVVNATMIENMYFTGRQAMDRQDWVAAHKSLSIYWWIVQYIYSQSANAEAVQFVHALSDNLAHVEWQYERCDSEPPLTGESISGV